jgi:hypothetical protein
MCGLLCAGAARNRATNLKTAYQPCSTVGKNASGAASGNRSAPELQLRKKRTIAMVRCEFYEGHKVFKIVEMPSVPRVGEGVIFGYGTEYRVMRVTDVNWDADPPGDIHMTARLSMTPQPK